MNPARTGEGADVPARSLVSVVMPAYNAAATLARSIESVLAQTRAELELIVVDDCSTDATPALIADYARADARVRSHRQAANAGVAAARNSGIELARGSHVAFLDSDDWWHPRKLELQITQMQRAGASISYCSYRRVAESGEELSVIHPPSRLTHADMLRSNFIGNLTGVYARELGPAAFMAIGHEDYVFWLQMIRRAGSALRIEHDEPLASYLVRDGSVSSNKLRAAGWQWRIYRDIEGMSVPKASRYMLHYAWNALAKRR
jgi:glycosyltransferase involved in cell wall biosynthesis